MQAAIQALAFLSGLIVIRLLPVNEYAWYTIANAILGTLIVLTDCGIAQGVMAQGGKVWQRRDALGGIVVAGMALRRQFGAAAALLSMPVLYLLLTQQDAPSGSAILVTASIIPLFLASLSGQVLEVVPRLHQRLMALQRIQLSGSALRLVAAASLVTLFPYAWLANIGAGLGQLWAVWRLRRLGGELASLDAAPDSSARQSIVQQVRRTAPGAVYYAFAGQISLWLISILGSTEAVAQVGALGRLAVVFNVITAVFSLVFVPRFARMQADQGSGVLARYWFVQLAMLTSLAAIVLWVAVFPTVALAVLGPAYAHLTHEVVLAAAGGAFGLLSGSAYALSGARGVVIAPWFVVPFAIFVQAALIVSLPMSTVHGVLWLGVLTNFTFWLMHMLYFSSVAMKKVSTVAG
jgi:hypothetical protein